MYQGVVNGHVDIVIFNQENQLLINADNHDIFSATHDAVSLPGGAIILALLHWKMMPMAMITLE